MIPAWCEPYVGLAYVERGRGPDSFDCWGLCREVWQREFGFALPSYVEDYESSMDSAVTAALFADGIPDGGWESVTDPRVGDGVLLRILGSPAVHVGLIVAPGFFLHTLPSYGASVIDRLDHPMWAKRILGYYRHPKVAV